MWILESEGDLFQGRRMWLKPGKNYLFGRVKRDGVRYALDHKTVSRKHFVVSVGDVKAGDSARFHARTKITITDEKSKHGTYVDGRLLRGASRDLSWEKHSIRPGTLPSELVIKWLPCNLTFQITKKDLKAGALKAKADRLESLDVKVLADYISGVTTHVVAGKRNTPKGLQALIQGRFLVGDSFVDALLYAATPGDLGEEENLSLLEQDFGNSWPSELDNLAPRGKEPTERPDAAYSPDPTRTGIFEDFQFVFLDKAQYENLLPVVTTGQGKALHFELRNGESSVETLVEYMRNAAGRKGFGDVEDNSPKGGAVMVLWDGHPHHEEWTANLIREVALKLDQRPINQAEFLDAILATDASLLKQSLAFESTMDGRRPPPATPADSFAKMQLPPRRQLPQFDTREESGTTKAQSPPFEPEEQRETPVSVTNGSQRVPSSVPEAASQNQANPVQEPPRKKTRLRHVPGRRFKQFDDDFDENTIPAYVEEAFPTDSQSLNAFITDSREQSLVPSVKEEPELNGKRGRSDEAMADSEEDLMDDIFPAAAAVRRQQAGLTANGDAVPPPPIGRKKRKEKEINVREVAKAQRKAEEDAAQKEREAEGEVFAQEDHSGKPANLVVIEEMPLRAKPPARATRASADANDRWDPKWNGRKNFKTFKKSGTGNGTEPRRRLQKVMVALVETKTSGFGFGDRSGESHSIPKKTTHTAQSQAQSQSPPQHATQPTSQTVSGTDEVVEISSDVEPESERQTSPQLIRLQAEAASIMDHAIDADSPRRTRLADKNPAAIVRSSQKRPASTPGLSGRTKRPKSITMTRKRDDESDSDGMRFKFGRRKK